MRTGPRSPNNAAANRELAIGFYFLGRWEDALRQADVAERLNPLNAAHMAALHDTAGTALVALHRYDEAVERSRRGAATNPSNLVPLLVAASAEAHRNNLAAARQQAAEILKRQPGYWVGRDRSSRGSTAPDYVAGMDHFREGLKLAGVPAEPSDRRSHGEPLKAVDPGPALIARPRPSRPARPSRRRC